MDENIDRIEEYEEDGIVFEKVIYKDGYIDRRVKQGYEDAIPTSEQSKLEMASNIEYLIDLTEMNMEV